MVNNTKNIILLIFLGSLISCASYYDEMQNIKRNPKDIIAFKKILENKYQLAEFDKYETIWTLESKDDKIKTFGRENRINAIIKIPKDTSSHFFQRYGNIVQLTFVNIYFTEENQSVIFDYTEKGLKNYDQKFAKSEIADRIYIFR